MAFNPNLFAAAFDLDQDPLQHQPDDGLTFFLGRALGSPEGGEILGNTADAGQFGRSWRHQPLAPEAFILCCQATLFGQGFLPGPFESPGDQAVLGVHGGILPASQFSGVAGPLQTLLPMLVSSQALGFKIGSKR